MKRSETPELKLLLSCVPGMPSTRQQAAVRLNLDRVANWDQVIGLAQRHRIIPQMYRTLAKYDTLVPRHILAELQTQNQHCVLQGMLMQAELGRIANAFHAANIALIGLKGPVAEQQVYAPGHRRQYRDLDLLIRPETLSAGCAILEELGYDGQVADIGRSSSAQIQRLTRYYKHVHGHRMAGHAPLVVELHWRLGGTPRMFTECEAEIWQRPASVRFGNSEISALPDCELLIYLAYHGSRHRWKRLSWMCDFCRAVERTPDDRWNEILACASRLRLRPYLDLGLSMLQDLVPHDPLPRPVREHLRNAPGLSRAMASCRHALVADEMFYENQAFSGVRWYFELEHCLTDRLHALATLLTPTEDSILQSGWWRSNLSRLQHLWRRSLGVLFDSPADGRTEPQDSDGRLQQSSVAAGDHPHVGPGDSRKSAA